MDSTVTPLPFTIRKKKAAPLPPPATPASIQAIQTVDIDRAVSTLPTESTPMSKSFDVSSLLPASQTPEAIAQQVLDNAFSKFRVKNGLFTGADLLAVLQDNVVKPYLDQIQLPSSLRGGAPAPIRTSAPKKQTNGKAPKAPKASGKRVFLKPEQKESIKAAICAAIDAGHETRATILDHVKLPKELLAWTEGNWNGVMVALKEAKMVKAEGEKKNTTYKLLKKGEAAV